MAEKADLYACVATEEEIAKAYHDGFRSVLDLFHAQATKLINFYQEEYAKIEAFKEEMNLANEDLSSQIGAIRTRMEELKIHNPGKDTSE